MTFGITPQGFGIKRLANIQQELENAMKAQFGEINVAPQSVFGQIIGVYSKILADIWEDLQDVYFSQYPNSAEGIALDNVVILNGITRRPATRTSVNTLVFGNSGTLIPANSQVKIPGTNTVLFNPQPITISITRANSATIEVTELLPQVYSVLINSEPFRFSIPLLTRTGEFSDGNVISVIVNGTTLGPIGWAGTSANTNVALANLLATHPDVLAVGTPTASTITVTPVAGKYVVAGPVNVTLGTTSPTYATTYDTPSSIGQVAGYLTAIINAGNQPVNAQFSAPPYFNIISNEIETPFSLSVSAGLNTSSLSSPGLFLSQEFGPVPVPANSVTEIVTPVSGWAAVYNPNAGQMGSFVETDAELRLRRLRALRALGAATVESIRSRLLQEVPGVTNVFIFENVSIKQQPSTITLSTQLITDNVVSVTIDGVALNNTVFTTNHLTTMQLVANKIMLVDGVESVTITGINNLTLNIQAISGTEVTIDLFEVSDGVTQPQVTISRGRPPKSFEAIVAGGSNLAVAQKIWEVKPAGIQTFGNVNNYNGVPIIDSQGDTQYIYFSRAIPVYIWVKVALTLYPGETFPLNGIEDVKTALLSYGDLLGIGQDVLQQRVLAQVFRVPGIANADVQLAYTLQPDGSPAYSYADIIINQDQVSQWAYPRIIVTVA